MLVEKRWSGIMLGPSRTRSRHQHMCGRMERMMQSHVSAVLVSTIQRARTASAHTISRSGKGDVCHGGIMALSLHCTAVGNDAQVLYTSNTPAVDRPQKQRL